LSSLLASWREDSRQRVGALRRAVHQPGPERDAVLLLVKAAIATVLAWQFAVRVLDSPVPFYAPMAALLVVDRTMVRSLSASAQRIAAVVLGLGVAWVVATLLGVTWWTMFGVILVALVIGRWSRLGEHGIQVPAMVLLSLITVGGTDEAFTVLTIVETVAGGVIGVATNAIVFAPLHLTRPRQRVVAMARQVRELLDDMADGLRGEWDAQSARRWYRLGSEIGDRAPFVVEDIHTGRESTRFNVRRGLWSADQDWEGYERTVRTLRRMVWQLTGIGRTLVDAAEDRDGQPEPSGEFLVTYADALGAMADAVSQLGRHDDESLRAFDAGIVEARRVLTGLRDQVRVTPLADPDQWPVYGSLISDSVRAVAELESAREVAAVPSETASLRTVRPTAVIRERVRRPRLRRR
jgi:hypothetical protein